MEELIEKSTSVLLNNWKQGFTIPTQRLYPFQWNWDSGFTALGQMHFNVDFAIQEMQNLFSGQWENGMLPHIIFHSENEDTYFPNYDFWNAQVNSGAPVKPKTSGITQPPVHGFVLEALVNKFPSNQKVLSFAKDLFPKILKLHQWFYTYRDPQREGLTIIYHPWESGRDNSPLWDNSLARIIIDKDTLPKYTRKDTSISEASERPTSDEYDKYVYLLELGKKYKYEERAIFDESPFLIQDTLMNAILIRSNKALIQLGTRLGFDVAEIEEWQQASIPKFNEKLWYDALDTYVVYDLRGQTQIKHKEIGGLCALFAEIPDLEKANKLNDYLQGLHARDFFLCPSFDPEDALFDSKRYWRGPIWPQMNWIVYHGLKAYGFEATANIVKNNFFELVNKLGLHEYFESQKSLVKNLEKGYGGSDFSWTAACILDLIHEQS